MEIKWRHKQNQKKYLYLSYTTLHSAIVQKAVLGWEVIGLLQLYLTNLTKNTCEFWETVHSWRKKQKSNIFPAYCTSKVWILFVLHSCCLSSWSQWWPWGAQCFRRACHTPTKFWVPKNNLGKLYLCISASHGNVSADPVDSASLWTPRSLSFSAMQSSEETLCLGYIRLLNSRYLSKYIYLMHFFFFSYSSLCFFWE